MVIFSRTQILTLWTDIFWSLLCKLSFIQSSLYSVQYLWKMNVQYSTVFCNSYVCKKVDFRILFIKVRSEWTLIVSITFFSGLFTQQSSYQRKYFLEHAFECSEILVSLSQRVLTTNSLWWTNTYNIHFPGRAGSAGPVATGCRPLYIHIPTCAQ
jgi:hypothetical protein